MPLTSRASMTGFHLALRNDREQQLAAFGASGTLFGIVHKTSTAVAALDWTLWRKAASGNKEDRVEVSSHAILDMWNAPNEFYTNAEFCEATQQHIDLTGEGWWLVERSAMVRSVVLGMWPVRPDRMTPVPSVDSFIAGYIYTSPDGERIPLQRDEVIQIKMPNPLDPYRGLGPVQSILTYVDSAKYGAEWNRTFFLNSAEPGGIIEIDKRLSDTEFKEMTTRWREQHQGVSAAHRVAIVEQGKWVDRKFSQRDMQFAQLQTLSRDTIMEAFGFPKSMLGVTEDVNRANAETGKEIFAENLTVPRANRLRDALNYRLLPMFGAVGLEMDYKDPTPDNKEQLTAEQTAQCTNFATLISAGVDPDSAAEIVGLPPVVMKAVVATAPSGALDSGALDVSEIGNLVQKVYLGVDKVVTWTEARQMLNDAGANLDLNLPQPAPAPTAFGAPAARWVLRNEATGGQDVDLTAVQDAWEHALSRLLAEWGTVTGAQYDALVRQVREAVDGDKPLAPADLTVSTDDAYDKLLTAMVALGESAGGQVRREAEAQGVSGVDPVAPKRSDLTAGAVVAVGILAAGLAISAAAAALRARRPGAPGHEVADAVRAHLDALTDMDPRLQLGGALGAAQTAGRVATLRAAPDGALYASEQNDSNTCGPCREVDGRWLGNISDMEMVEKTYPFSGYVHCLGGARCRGTVVGVWRPDQTGGEK